MSKTEIQEKLIEIAIRKAPGDNWKVHGVDKIQSYSFPCYMY